MRTMPDPGEIRMLKPADDLHTCPACGYNLGFHTSFVNASANKDNPIKSTRETWRVILICPECGARYDVGWRISFAEFESKFVKAPATPSVTNITPKSPHTGTTPAPAEKSLLLPAPHDTDEHAPE